jgi:hypothetical protein
MNNRVLLLGGAAVVAIGAAFAAGHYMSSPQDTSSPQTPSPAPALSAQTAAPPSQTAPEPEQPAPSPTLTPSATAPSPVKAPPPKRVADYASGEDEYDEPPPPPPPPPEEFHDHPNPFEASFNPFPMRHSGAGTIASPLTWRAQTNLGQGREADLRISILVPEPSPNDKGQFWRKWGANREINLMPDVTRGTPVIVAGSASVIVAVDPEILDLRTPAVLTVSGHDGDRIYRSRDAAPARGETWDSDGARWIFLPDAEFYRLMRDGADISITVRNRLDDRAIRIPFDTRDFAPTARSFEHTLARRMDAVSDAWYRARPGTPPPVRPGPQKPHDEYPGNPDSGSNRPGSVTNRPGADQNTGRPDRGHNRGQHDTDRSTQSDTTHRSPQSPGTGTNDAAKEAAVRAFRAPKDACGPQPAFTVPKDKIMPDDKKAYAAKRTWIACEANWYKQYRTGIAGLATKLGNAAKPADALKSVMGGDAVLSAYIKASSNYNAEAKLWAAQTKSFTALAKKK